jgi:hypothetical protein
VWPQSSQYFLSENAQCKLVQEQALQKLAAKGTIQSSVASLWPVGSTH